MKRFLLMASVCLLTGASAFAGPSWTPQTYQLFDFMPDEVTPWGAPDMGGGIGGTDLHTFRVTPTIDDNPFGDPYGFVEVDNTYDPDGYVPDGDYFHGWAISVGSGLIIPNSAEPNPYKNIWVEIRFDPDLVNYEVRAPDTGGPFDVELMSFDSFADPAAPDSGWWIAQIEWQIRPNPTHETLWFDFLDHGTKLDYIEIYTQCVPIPAPGAILLAGIGTGLVGWMRRRRAL